MRNTLLLLVMLGVTAAPALAAKRVTEDELKQTLAAAQTMHRTDDVVAQQLGDMKLANRLTGAALEKLLAPSPGPKSAQALHAIADASAFLDPPADELPGTAAPDEATQKAILGRTIDYVSHTMPSLPNLSATRVTERFVDSQRGLEQQTLEPRGGLLLMGTYSAPIAFRDGRETDTPALAASLASDKKGRDKKPMSGSAAGGLSSWGEFGPVLGVVLLDAAKGKLGWARWELEDGKQVAVYQFAIDRSVSHYEVIYCCEATGGSIDYARGGTMGTEERVVDLKPGYHGRLEVDPETGAVLRITVEAELHPSDPIQKASMMVEYGPVQIGDGTHICPTRSVSVSISRAQFLMNGAMQSTNRMLLNDVVFTNYHRFGSVATMIADVPAEPGAPAAGGAAGPAETALAGSGPGSAGASVAAAAPAGNETAVEAPPVTSPAPAPPVEEKEIKTDADASMPGLGQDAAGNGAAGSDATGGFTLKANTRSVDVGLVADDKRGKPVTDLKQEEIEIYDNGRRQQLRGFSHETPGAAVAPAAATEATDSFTNTASAAVELQESPDLLILLLDESHLAYQDLNRARGEVERFLAAAKPNTRAALYSISEHGFRVIQDVTQDQALLEKKLAAWVPSASAVSQAQALERRNHQDFDTVHSTRDLNSVNGNNIDSPDTMQTTDPELRQMGDNPLNYALEGMTALARHFAPVPGHKSIAWISGDSALADWEDKAVGMEKGSKQLEAALLHTREALNEAHIALYAVDASAVEGGGIDASLYNTSVGVAATTQGAPTRSNGPGRSTAQMQQDLHAIQGPVRQLAESTGGRAVNKGGDLKATLDGIAGESASYYELAFDPDTPADGKFHAVVVKVPDRKNVVLRYRTGYLYSEETVSTKERFQQAVWSPQDMSGISLTAQAVTADESGSGKSAVKLRIGLAGLALTAGNNRWTDQLYIFVAERDDATQKAEVSGETLALSLKQTTYETGMPAGIPYTRDVEPKSKLGSVRIIVVDKNSGRMGSITLPASSLRP